MKFKHITRALSASLLIVLTTVSCQQKLSDKEVDDIYSQKSRPLNQAASIYFIGHSLIGRDIPLFLQQLSGKSLNFNSQLGWGATLKSHWAPQIYPINGFTTENKAPYYRDAHEAIESASYDAFVLTEMVEIKDAIRYHQSADNLANFVKKIYSINPQAQVYFYETWPNLRDPDGWLERLDHDLTEYWENQIVNPALAQLDAQYPIYMIPAGQVFAAFSRHQHRLGRPVLTHESLYTVDGIHLSDLGKLLVSITLYIALYHEKLDSIPDNLLKDDGTYFAINSATAKSMQEIAWGVVSTYPRSAFRVEVSNEGLEND